MRNSKETNYNSTHRTNYPFEHEQQKVLKIFKCIKQSSSSDITYGKFTSLWHKKHIRDFFIGAFKVAQLCGGGNISDKKLQAYMKKIFDKYFSIWGNFSIEALDAELLKFPQVYNIEPTPDKKETMDSKKLYITCVEDVDKQKKYRLLKRRKTKPPLEIGNADSIEKINICLDNYILKDKKRKQRKAKRKEKIQIEFEMDNKSSNPNLKHLDSKTEFEMVSTTFEALNIGHNALTLKCAKMAAVKKKYREMYPEMGRGIGKMNDPYFQRLYSDYREYMLEKEKVTTISTAQN